MRLFLKKPGGMDLKAADQILQNVLSACNRPPNTVPLQTLMNSAPCKTTGLLMGKISAGLCALCVLAAPVATVPATLSSTVQEEEGYRTATVRVAVHTLFPVRSISGQLGGKAVELQRQEGDIFTATVDQNGTLSVTITTQNGAKSTENIPITQIDDEIPHISGHHREGEHIIITLSDNLSGVDYEGIYLMDENGARLAPLLTDAAAGTITVRYTGKTINLFIPDRSGNVLQAVLSPSGA